MLLMFAASIGISLAMIPSIYVILHPILSIRKSILVILVETATFFIMGQLAFVLWIPISLLICSIVLVKLTSKSYTSLCFPALYIYNCMICHILLIPELKISGLTPQEQDKSIFWTCFTYTLMSIASFLTVYPIRKKLEKRPIGKQIVTNLERADKKLIYISAGFFLVCAELVFCIASMFYKSGLLETYISSVISFMLFMLIFALVIVFIFFTAEKKSYEAEKKVEYLDNLNEYTRNLEVVYNNMRSFKHDYVNIMAALSAYIDEKRYDELERFFYEHILPMNKSLTQKNETINNLQKIKNMELKSILYTKMILAVNQNIDATIDIPDEINDVNMDPVDLTRTLGVYMDNAIEASLETEKPVLNLHMGKVDDDVVCIISNNYIDKGLSISQMQKKDVTTKGTGHGLGLYNVSEILNKYSNIFHETYMEDGLFVQQLRIS
ncbi:MAG: GHKL domain-containing protein [Eubacterium sp.]|nr:GHKL domain-containing protein [Eubacterium sp.]